MEGIEFEAIEVVPFDHPVVGEEQEIAIQVIDEDGIKRLYVLSDYVSDNFTMNKPKGDCSQLEKGNNSISEILEIETHPSKKDNSDMKKEINSCSEFKEHETENILINQQSLNTRKLDIRTCGTMTEDEFLGSMFEDATDVTETINSYSYESSKNSMFISKLKKDLIDLSKSTGDGSYKNINDSKKIANCDFVEVNDETDATSYLAKSDLECITVSNEMKITPLDKSEAGRKSFGANTNKRNNMVIKSHESKCRETKLPHQEKQNKSTCRFGKNSPLGKDNTAIHVGKQKFKQFDHITCKSNLSNSKEGLAENELIKRQYKNVVSLRIQKMAKREQHVDRQSLESNDETSDDGRVTPDGEVIENIKMQKSRRVHSENNFICHVCGEGFKVKETYENHLYTHEENSEKPYKCQTCGISFIRKCYLNRHMTCHTGVRPFSCNECDKSFRTKSDLHRHERIHSEKEGLKQYKCDICGRRFCAEDGLLRHQRAHKGDKPYKCKECSKWFSMPADLRRHKKTHTGGDMFTCNLCDKVLTSSVGFKRHQRLHSGDKPYHCKQCGNSFIDQWSLIKHREKMHNHKNGQLKVNN